MITLRLTPYQAKVLHTILQYQFTGEFDGGPIPTPREQAAAERVLSKLCEEENRDARA